MNKDHTNIIYDRMTGRVILYEVNGIWVMPTYMNLAHYENGFTPVFDEDEDGNLYFNPNSFMVENLKEG